MATTPHPASTLSIASPDRDEAGAAPCFELCLFDDRPRDVSASGYAEALEIFLQREAPNLSWFKTNTMKRAKAIPGTPLEQIQSLLGSAQFTKDGLIGLEQHSGTKAEQYAAPSLKLFSEQVAYPGEAKADGTFIRFCLPGNRAEDPNALHDMMGTLCTSIAVHCAYAGFSWYWNTGDTGLEDEIGNRVGLLLRHPCMGYSDPFAFQSFVGNGLIQVGWLTVLGTALLKQAGGLDSLAPNLDGTVTVTDLGPERGVLLRAGAEPILGSNNPAERDALTPYVSVGQATNGLRLPDEDLEFIEIPGVEEEDDVRSWYLRFFGDPEK